MIRSEWIKMRSLRSTWYSLLAAVVIVVGLGTLFSAIHANRVEQGNGPGGQISLDATQISLRGVFLAQLAIGVLGVLVITGEYSTGMIRSSLAAVPHRQPVLIAKALVFGVVVFVVSLASTLAAFLLGQQAQASTHQQASLGTHDAIRAIVGGAIYLTLIGLLAVGLGFLIRNTAGAIATLFGIVLVAPILAAALPDAVLERREQVPAAERRNTDPAHQGLRPYTVESVGRDRRHRPVRGRCTGRRRDHAQAARRLNSVQGAGTRSAGPWPAAQFAGYGVEFGRCKPTPRCL